MGHIRQLFWTCLTVLLLLTGCFGGLTTTIQQAEQRNFISRKIQTEMFDLQAFISPVSSAPVLRVVIEGDGLAYRFGKVNHDPTPRQATGLEIALAADAMHNQNSVAIAYLARPCQFVSNRRHDQPEICDNPIYWTHHRYAPYIVDQMADAIQQLQMNYRSERVELIGYSGGGVLALLLAARHPQMVSQVVTIASPIDLGRWVRYHKLTPLIGSLDPMDYLSTLNKVPQLHVIGEDDDNVPIKIISVYQKKSQTTNVPIQFLLASGRDHQGDWPSFWPQIMQAARLSP